MYPAQLRTMATPAFLDRLKSGKEKMSKEAIEKMLHHLTTLNDILSRLPMNMSSAISWKDIGMINFAFKNFAPFLSLETISGVAAACQVYRWPVMKVPYSTAIAASRELGDSCQTLQALVEGSGDQIPQTFIDEEISIILEKANLLYASDAPQLIWVLRQEMNRTRNQSSILRLLQKNICNSSLIAEFLNLLYWDADANLMPVKNQFFERLLPTLAFTFSFLPYKQPLHSVAKVNSAPQQDSGNKDCSDVDEEKLCNEWKEWEECLHRAPGPPFVAQQDSENKPCSYEEEEKLFNEWEQHWKHLEDDQRTEAAQTNAAIEGINGQRVYDEPLGGKDLAVLIQAASQLGFNETVEQILELLVPNFGKVTPEQCHTTLLAFFDTMLQQKIGRAILEKHKAGFRAMLSSYIHNCLAPPTADMSRPQVECHCVQCKALNKFLEDPQSEREIFFSESTEEHLHLIKQIRIANHRYTWGYRYGPNDGRSGEQRRKFPWAWSYRLRKRFPKQEIANKGYKYATEMLQHVSMLTITKWDRKLTLARESFDERMTNAKQLRSKMEGSRLGRKFWSDAMKDSQLIDRTEVSQSKKLLKAQAAAKQLIAAFVDEAAATTPIQNSSLPATGKLNERYAAGTSLENHLAPTIAKLSTLQSPSQVAMSPSTSNVSKSSRPANSVQVATSPAANPPDGTAAHTAEPPGNNAASYVEAPITTQTRNSGKRAYVSDPATPDNGPQTNLEAQGPGLKFSGTSPSIDGTATRALRDMQSPQHYRSSKADTHDLKDAGSRSREQSEVRLCEMAKLRGKEPPRGVRDAMVTLGFITKDQEALESSRPSTRTTSKELVTSVNLESDSNGDKGSSFDSSLPMCKELGMDSEGGQNRSKLPLALDATHSELSQYDSISRSKTTPENENDGCTAILRRLKGGVWKLSDEQIRIDLGAQALLYPRFLYGLEILSKARKVTWEHALTALLQVRSKRRKEEAAQLIPSSIWTFEDILAALKHIYDRKKPEFDERLQRYDRAAPRDLSALFSTEPQPRSPRAIDIRSTTPPGDPPSTWRGFGSFAPSLASVSGRTKDAKAKDCGHMTRQPIEPAAPPHLSSIFERSFSNVSTPTPPSVSVREPVWRHQNSGHERGGDASISSRSPVVPMAQVTGLRNTGPKAHTQNSQALLNPVAAKNPKLKDVDDNDASDASDASDGMRPGWPKGVMEVLGELNNAPAIRKMRVAGAIVNPAQATKIRRMLLGDPSSKYRLSKSRLERCLGETIECPIRQDQRTGKPLYCNDEWVFCMKNVEGSRGEPSSRNPPNSTTTPILDPNAGIVAESCAIPDRRSFSDDANNQKNSGIKRKAYAAGLSSDRESAITRRRKDIPKKAKVAVVIELLDSEDETEIVASLPMGSKENHQAVD